jgi:hypothetical protein
MSSTPESPDWSLLPNRPKDFLGLEDGYDEKQLKRAYNRFLKAFKPEKFPAEFQRIRQAYEDLERRLRYQIRDDFDADPGEFNLQVLFPASRPVHGTFAAADQSHPSPDGSSSAHTRPGSKTTIVDRLDETSVEELLTELEQKKSKSALEYYHLAILRDSQPCASPDVLIQTLLSGLDAHPHEPGLHRLIAAELNGRSQLGPETLEWLEHLARAMCTGRFYELTEMIWSSLLDQVPFEDWAASLKRCEAAMGVLEPFWATGFYVRILPQAVWSADSEWIDAAQSRFDASTFGGGGDIDEVLATLEQTRQYVEAHRQLTDPPEVVVQLFDFLKRQSRSTFAAGLYTFRRFHRDIRNSEDRWLADWGQVNKPYRLLASAAYQRVVGDYEGLSTEQLFDVDLIAVETRQLNEAVVEGLRRNNSDLVANVLAFVICVGVVLSQLLVVAFGLFVTVIVALTSYFFSFTFIALIMTWSGVQPPIKPGMYLAHESQSLFHILASMILLSCMVCLEFRFFLIFIAKGTNSLIGYWCTLMGTSAQGPLDWSAVYRGALGTSLRLCAKGAQKTLLLRLQKSGMSLPWIQWHFSRFANSLPTRQRAIVDDWSADPGAQVVYTARRWWPNLNGPGQYADDDVGTPNSPDEA